jgi:hypothetical protein
VREVAAELLQLLDREQETNEEGDLDAEPVFGTTSHSSLLSCLLSTLLSCCAENYLHAQSFSSLSLQRSSLLFLCFFDFFSRFFRLSPSLLYAFPNLNTFFFFLQLDIHILSHACIS